MVSCLGQLTSKTTQLSHLSLHHLKTQYARLLACLMSLLGFKRVWEEGPQSAVVYGTGRFGTTCSKMASGKKGARGINNGLGYGCCAKMIHFCPLEILFCLGNIYSWCGIFKYYQTDMQIKYFFFYRGDSFQNESTLCFRSMIYYRELICAPLYLQI